VPGQVFYRPGLFAASVAIAVAAATASLTLAYTLRSLRSRIAAALVMAVAICGMHYTGMAATVIVPGPAIGAPVAGVVEGGRLAWAVAASMAAILALSLACAFVDRRFERQALAMAEIDKARQAAEAADRAKSEFLANISHEIRTPLNGVLGLSSMLLRTRLEAAQREMVETIEASARTLNVLLSDVLDIARIEAGRIELEAVPFSPAECIRHVRDLFAPAAADKGLAFVVEIAPALEDSMVGDPTRLTQILTNLCSNAVKFTGAGAITLRARCEGEGPARRAVVEVADTGIGVSPEAAAQLFQRFVQVDGSMRRTSGGAGLGLAISRTLARLMDGDLTCRSALGQGSTFTLTVSLRRWTGVGAVAPPSANTPLATPSASPARTPSVLLVEDHPVNRRIVELILGDRVALECVENGSLGLPPTRPARSTSCSWTCRCRSWTASRRRARFAPSSGRAVVRARRSSCSAPTRSTSTSSKPWPRAPTSTWPSRSPPRSSSRPWSAPSPSRAGMNPRGLQAIWPERAATPGRWSRATPGPMRGASCRVRGLVAQLFTGGIGAIPSTRLPMLR
jgi:signal transduction histidine kinase